MKYARTGLALAALLGCVPAAEAQLVYAPSPYGVAYSVGGFGVGVSRHGGRRYTSAFIAGSGYYAYYGVPYYPIIPSRVTVVQVVTPPPVVIAPPPVMLPDATPRPRVEEVEPPQEKPMAGGGFRPVRPPVPPVPPPPPIPRVPEVPPVEPPKEKPRPQPPPQEKPREPAPPREPKPALDPRNEGDRQIELGLDAFAAGEYGRAAGRFQQAIHVSPNNPRAYFLLGQAEVALGKYDEAVEVIQSGLRLAPDWPTTAFRPVTLYGDNVADLPAHLQRLEDALTRHPDDPVLLFLSAYELWFDGRQDEARALFQRAAAVAPDRSFSERFLLARPDQPVL